LGDAEVGVDGAGVLPVLVRGAGDLAGGGEAVVGAGLLVAVPGAAGEGERGGEAAVGLGVLAGGQQSFPSPVECLGAAAVVAYALVKHQGLLVVSGGLVIVALPVTDLAKPVESAGLFPLVAGLAGSGERGGEAVLGSGVLAGGQQGFPGVVEGCGLCVALAELLEQSQRLMLMAHGLVVLAQPVVHPAQREQRVGLTGPMADLAGGGEGLLRRLTSRELAVLRMLAAGRTNAQIGAELYISPTTARVHVTNILRKLGVTSRVQAAALAERAGLLDPGQP
jgi:DNA-binding CsgD family transcriptional regulator